MRSHITTNTFLSIFLIVLFLYQSLGLPNGENVVFISLVIWTFVTVLTQTHTNFLILPKIFSLFVLFIILGAGTTISSVNIENSMETYIFTICLIWIFFYFNINSKNHQKSALNLILIFGLLATLYSSLIYILLQYKIDILVPRTSNQLVYAFYAHNNLAHIVGPALIIALLLFISQKKIRYLLLSTIYLVPFIFSFSRTAYLALVITLLVYLIINKSSIFSLKKMLLSLIGIALLVPVLLFFTTAREFDSIKSISYTRKILTEKLGLQEKAFFSGRPVYMRESAAAINDKFLSGFGPGNYWFASIKHSYNPSAATATSFNIILDYLVEYGVLTGFIFILLLVKIIYSSTIPYLKSNPLKIDQNQTILALIIIFMSIVFLFDSVFRTQSYFGLFLFLCSILYKERARIQIRSTYVILFQTVIVFIVLQSLISGMASKANMLHFAKLAYPITNSERRKLIDNLIISKKTTEAKENLEELAKFYNNDPHATLYLAGRYEELKEFQTALYYYDQTFINMKFPTVAVIDKIHKLKKKYAKPEEISQFEKTYVKRLDSATNFWNYTPTEVYMIKNFCSQTNQPCPDKIYEYLQQL